MPNRFVPEWSAKAEVGVVLVEIDLPQTEEIEMVDQECADEDDAPTGEENNLKDKRQRWVANLPNNAEQRSPLPEQQRQSEARQQDVSAALDYLRHNLRPHLLKTWPRHCAVLNCEKTQQNRVDDQRLREVHFAA